MLVRQFLTWAETANAASRAEGCAALARAYLASGNEGGLDDEQRIEAELALTAMLDDGSPQVRRALAEVCATSPHVPRHIISALAADQSDVSAPVLNRSPLLGAAELIECARVADAYGQAAIALRPGLPGSVAAALAEHAGCEALVALAVNETAALSEASMLTMLERFGEDGELREALLARGDTSDAVRCVLVEQTGRALESFVVASGWVAPERAGRAVREARDTGLIEIAAQAADTSESAALQVVRHLRASSLLTPAMLLRALLSGNRSLTAAALGELAGQSHGRALGLVKAWSGPGFAALYDKAGMPVSLLPAFRAALAAQDDYGLIFAPGQRPALSHGLIVRTLKTLESLHIPEFSSVIGMLQRLGSEAARAEARRMSESLRKSLLAPPVAAPLAIDMDALEAELLVAA